jgi:hypothetical protein
VILMSSVTADVTVPGPPARPAGGEADRTAPAPGAARPVRSWPLLALAVPAAAEVWSGWVGIAQQTGFGMVSPLPGIWPSLHLDTAVSLPVGVEAYAAYALRAWLAREPWISARTRRFAKRSAIFSFTLGMAGQVAYHLLAQAGAARAPWPVTTLVSCLPVLVLAMGTALAHMIRADTTAADQPGKNLTRPAEQLPAGQPQPDQPPLREDRGLPDGGPPTRPAHQSGNGQSPPKPRSAGHTLTEPARTELARLVARDLAGRGQRVSRRALRSAGVTGSNQALNTLAQMLNAEFTATTA